MSAARLATRWGVLWLVCLCGGTALAGGSLFDYPVGVALPSWDLSVGPMGGVAFSEAEGAGSTGGQVGVEVGLHEGVLTAQTGVRWHREGRGARASLQVEIGVWYVVLVGLGARFGWPVDDPRGTASASQALTVLVAAPIPLWSGGATAEGGAGSIFLMPYGRPGMRFDGPQDITGFHEVGLALRWTTFGW